MQHNLIALKLVQFEYIVCFKLWFYSFVQEWLSFQYVIIVLVVGFILFCSNYFDMGNFHCSVHVFFIRKRLLEREAQTTKILRKRCPF